MYTVHTTVYRYHIQEERFSLLLENARTLIIYEEIFFPNDFPPDPFRISLFTAMLESLSFRIHGFLGLEMVGTAVFSEVGLMKLDLCLFNIVDKEFILITRFLTVGRVYVSGTCTKCTGGSAFFCTGYIGIETVLKVLHQKMCKEYRTVVH